jgi:hypothetical protein
MSKLKARNFTFALEPRRTPHIDNVILTVKTYPKWAYIMHDKDVKDDGTGELKEPHYHFYVEFPNPRYLDAIATELNIMSNMIEKVWNKKGILEYLTHENQPEKYHYDKQQIVSNFDIEDDVVNSTAC